MIRKYIFGEPVETGAVVESIAVSNEHPRFGNIISISPFCWKYSMQHDTRIFGLGESVRGMNKRGYLYESWCSDVPRQDEGTKSRMKTMQTALVVAKQFERNELLNQYIKQYEHFIKKYEQS